MNAHAAGAESLTEKLIVEKNGGVGYIGLNQPEKHNAITYDMWQGIARVIDDFELDRGVRVMVFHLGKL